MRARWLGVAVTAAASAVLLAGVQSWRLEQAHAMIERKNGALYQAARGLRAAAGTIRSMRGRAADDYDVGRGDAPQPTAGAPLIFDRSVGADAA